MVLFGVPFLLPIDKNDEPNDSCDDHQAAECLASAHSEKIYASDVCVRFTEKFNEESKKAVSHKVEAGHLVLE